MKSSSLLEVEQILATPEWSTVAMASTLLAMASNLLPWFCLWGSGLPVVLAGSDGSMMFDVSPAAKSTL